jgi:phosphatidylglycerol:prolipoprotein diacylglycerol transferase
MPGYITYPLWIKPEIIPGFPFLRWYGLMYLVAFAITYFLFRYQVRERDLEVKSEDIFSLFFWAIIGLLIGARLFAVTIYDKDGYFLRNPLQAFLPFSWTAGQFTYTGFQGLSYHGGLVGALVAIILYCRIKRIDVLEWGDMLVAGVPLGYTFGRLGNFINAELYGRVTALPWGVVFPRAEPIPTDQPWVHDFAERVGIDITGLESVNLPRHPSQLYEAFFEGIFLWLILWFVFRKRRPFRGFLIGIYVIGYGVVRFLIEYVRQPDPGIDFPLMFGVKDNPAYLLLSPWNFTMGQILNAIMILGGVLSLFLFHYLARRRKEEKSPAKPSMKKLRRKIR